MKEIFIVESSGHGFPFVKENPATLLSFEEAKKDADRWCSIADTIGGRARVVNSQTNEVVYNA